MKVYLTTDESNWQSSLTPHKHLIPIPFLLMTNEFDTEHNDKSTEYMSINTLPPRVMPHILQMQLTTLEAAQAAI